MPRMAVEDDDWMAIWQSDDKRARAIVEFDDYTGPHSVPTWRWTLQLDGNDLASEADLHGPRIGPEPTAVDMLATLSSFIGAWQEAKQHGDSTSENADLFPESAEDWQAYAEEFSSWGYDHEDTEGVK